MALFRSPKVVKVKLYHWFIEKLREPADPTAEWRMGARNYANELRKLDPRMATELDAAIDRRECQQEPSARSTAGN